MVKTDCFAYGNDGCNPECTALNPNNDGGIPCRKGKNCHAYKSRESYLAELMRINGTTNMTDIITSYASADPDKRRERWLAIVKRVKGESNA